MRLELLGSSRVLIDLRATGLLRAIGHDPTLTARAEPFALDVDATGWPGEAFEVPVVVRFRSDAIEPPDDIPPSDRDKMRENLRGPEVLDVARVPFIEVRGRYAGTLEAGTLSGELIVRAVPRRVSMPIRTRTRGAELVATAVWEGTLTDVGIRPFKALMGALKLKDWIRLRLEAHFRSG
jgi:hypothetical protein